jgi:hypothetical protein
MSQESKLKTACYGVIIPKCVQQDGAACGMIKAQIMQSARPTANMSLPNLVYNFVTNHAMASGLALSMKAVLASFSPFLSLRIVRSSPRRLSKS